jgi:hypothetical protein
MNPALAPGLPTTGALPHCSSLAGAGRAAGLRHNDGTRTPQALAETGHPSRNGSGGPVDAP